jgi:predicted nuclease of predicted toxin-antitoxin system
MKLLLDMNLTPRWAEFLESADFQVLHWSRLGRADASDSEIMEYAAEHEFVVLTHDLDFSAILAATQGKKPSVIQIRAKNIAPEVVGKTIIAALRHSTDELEAGALLTIDADRTRIRLLPLQFDRR